MSLGKSCKIVIVRAFENRSPYYDNLVRHTVTTRSVNINTFNLCAQEQQRA
jgi:hypothetical protein